jgi:TetR/AcrR family transcriptional regulator, copper-responsive repressor
LYDIGTVPDFWELFTDVYNIFMSLEKTPSARTAGRPRLFDREAALEIALDRFWRQGFEGTSTTQLTAAMGISQPSLYAAFGSKEQLYREAVSLYVKRHGQFLSMAFSAHGSAREAISQALLLAARQYCDSTHAPGCMIASAGLQGGADHAVLFSEMAELRFNGQRAIHARLEQARLDGELAADTDTAAFAAYFAMVIQGMAVQAIDGAKAAALEAMATLAMKAWPSGTI